MKCKLIPSMGALFLVIFLMQCKQQQKKKEPLIDDLNTMEKNKAADVSVMEDDSGVLGKMKKEGDQFELVELKNTVFYKSNEIKISKVEIRYGDIGGEGEFPVIYVERQPQRAYVEYEFCQGTKCISDFSIKEHVPLIRHKIFDEKKILNLRVRACVEGEWLAGEGSNCSPWQEQKGLHLKFSTKAQLFALYDKAAELEADMRRDGVELFKQLAAHEGDSDEFFQAIGAHALAESLVDKAYSGSETGLALAGTLTEAICYTKTDYNLLKEEERCRLDKRIASDRWLRTNDEWYWNNEVLCSALICTAFLGCANKVDVGIYTVLTGSKCMERSESVKFRIGSTVAGFAGLAAIAAGGVMVYRGVKNGGLGYKIAGGGLLALGAGSLIAAIVMGAHAEGYFLSEQNLAEYRQRVLQHRDSLQEVQAEIQAELKK
ncbi:MAG: hypothetical protein KA436_12890 [Oligoflexales bacterium]|nr:hypothetical protein [Oligoflexales bacterium]